LCFVLSVFTLFVVSCTKSAGLTGSGSSSGGSFSSSITGSVNGGLSPVVGALVNLYQFGTPTPLATGTTNSSGAFTISYTNPGGSTAAFYVLVTGGNPGNGTNSNIQLGALLGIASNTPSSVVINEVTTTGFFNAAFQYGMAQDNNGTVSFKTPVNSAALNNMVAQYANFVTGGKAGNALSASTQSTMNVIANAIATCIENSANCATLFNNAIPSTNVQATSILDSIYNMLNATSNITNIFNLASTVSGSTGFTISSGQPTSFSIPPVVTTNTFTASTNPVSIALDASGNAWVANFGTNTVTEFSPSGAILATITVGTNPLGLGIDASGNLWVPNQTSNNITELNSSGGTLGTFSANEPQSVAFDTSGHIWVTYFSSNTVAELNSSGATVGTFPVGNGPEGDAIDASGNIWTANTTARTVTKLSPSGVTLGTFTLGAAPQSIAVDPSGNIWTTNNNTISKLNASGVSLGTFTLSLSNGLAFDASGNAWVSGSTSLVKLNSAGATLATYSVPSRGGGIAIDSSGNVWVASILNTVVTQFVGLAPGPQFFPYSGPVFPYANGY